MRPVPTNKILMREYRLSQDELFEILNKCVNYYLSEDELFRFVLEDCMKKEMRICKRLQK